MIRDRLAASSGLDAHLAWLFRIDFGIAEVYGSTVWGLEEHEREVSDLVAASDEIGAHPHGWRRDEAVGSSRRQSMASAWLGSSPRAKALRSSRTGRVTIRTHRAQRRERRS